MEREPGNLRNGNSDGSEDLREGATPKSNEQPKSQDPTPQRNRRIMRRVKAQGREARDWIGSVEEIRRSARNPRRVIDVMWEAGRLGRKKK